MSKNPKAIIFDMDDTILAWDAVSEQVWQDVCGRFAPVVGREAEQLYAAIDEMRKWYAGDPERHRYMRLNLIQYRREIVSMVFERLGVAVPELAIMLADAYSVQRVTAMYALPGALDALQRFKNSGMHLGLITNGTSESQREKIERFGLAPFFNHILVEEEFGTGKPDARVFLHALDKLAVTPAEAWMVGDDLERDIGGAQAVGISGIWVDWKGKGLPGSSLVQPDRIIKSIAELS